MNLMKHPLNSLVIGASLLMFGLAGCSKFGGHGPEGLDPAKIPAAVNQAFASASDEAKSAATNYIAVLRTDDPAAAFAVLRRLRAQKGLTPEQREVVARASQTTFKQLQAAAQNGNASAQAAVRQYLSTR